MADDQKSALTMLAVIAAMLVCLVVASWLMLPLIGDFVAMHFAPGLGLKNAAVISFFVTIVTLVIFAVAAGDGLLGELQYILGAFLGFFVIIWLMLAWIF